jgi:hypothetical protein
MRFQFLAGTIGNGSSARRGVSMSSDSARSGTCNPRHITAPRHSSLDLPPQKFTGSHYLLNLAMFPHGSSPTFA